MKWCILTAVLSICLLATPASAQCFGSTCGLPGRPVLRAVTAPVRLIQALPIANRQARMESGGWYLGKNIGRRERIESGGWYFGKNLRRPRLFRRWR